MSAAPRLPELAIARLSHREFEAFRALIHRETGIALSDAKLQLVESRLARRLRTLGIGGYDDYLAHLAHHDPRGAELREMVNCITTNKTSFFREEHHFAFLRERILAAAAPGRPVRIWSAGCSTGEEPYTLAITALEHFGEAAARRVQIVATDIDTDVIARAERAVYQERALEELPVAVRRRWFLRGTGSAAGLARVRPEVRALVRFRHLNLMAPTWSVDDQFDVVFCRNVIIYFDAPTRRRLIERFVERLPMGGHLLLGHSEMVPPEVTTLQALGQTVFRKQAAGERFARAERPAAAALRQPARCEPTPTPRARVVGRIPRPTRVAAPESHTRIIAGGVFASAEPHVVRTLLGSCVAACIWDPVAGVGGMNHFMLPDGDDDEHVATRYGVHALEVLINQIMQLGGDRERLEAKAFGAASVLQLSHDHANVAERNARFVKEFLATEAIPLRAHRLGGMQALDVHFQTATGRAFVRALGGDLARRAAEEDERYRVDASRSALLPITDDITLF